MDKMLNEIVERLNDFMEKRPGVLPLVAVFLIILNLLFQIVPGTGSWLADSNLFLHLGLILGIIGLLLISVYRH
jgi:hypothetical protein